MTNKPEFVTFVGRSGEQIFINRNMVAAVCPNFEDEKIALVYLAGYDTAFLVQATANEVVLRLSGFPVGEQRSLPA